MGMERAGHECVAFCEIDKFARASYKAIFKTEGETEFHDITSVSDDAIRRIGPVDVICGGFPCQAFSVAGKRGGFEDTRGTLFFEIARFAFILKPKLLFLENVKGLLNHDKGRTFRTILITLDELGYDAEWQVFNSKDFGVPQNRERVFIIGHLRGTGGRQIFPFRGEGKATHTEPKIHIVGSTKSESNTRLGTRDHIYHTQGLMGCLTATDYKQPKQILFGHLPGNFEMVNRVYDPKGISPTLQTMQGGDREPKIIQRGHGYNHGGEHDTAPTLASNSWQENNLLAIKEAITNFRIRKLTPKECWRLQGFPDWAFDKAQAVNSNSQLYKQAGNSVTVNVIEAIAKKL